MWHLGTQFSGGLGSVMLVVVLNDLKGFLQSKWFFDSTIIFNAECVDYKIEIHAQLIQNKHEHAISLLLN